MDIDHYINVLDAFSYDVYLLSMRRLIIHSFDFDFKLTNTKDDHFTWI